MASEYIEASGDAEETYVCTISYDFVLKFLPAFHGPFDENLRAKTERLGRQVTKFIRVVGET